MIKFVSDLRQVKSGFLRSFSTIFQLYRGGQFYWWSTRRKYRHVASNWRTLSYHTVIGGSIYEWTSGHCIICNGKNCKIYLGFKYVNNPDRLLKIFDSSISKTNNFNYSTRSRVIKFTSCLPMVGASLRVLRLLPPLTLVAMI